VGEEAMMVLGRKSSTWAIRFDEHGRALRGMGRRAMAAGWSPSSSSSPLSPRLPWDDMGAEAEDCLLYSSIVCVRVVVGPVRLSIALSRERTKGRQVGVRLDQTRPTRRMCVVGKSKMMMTNN
jgi:hypothetical protein